MHAGALKKNFTISLPVNVANKLKDMNDQNEIAGISKFCTDAIIQRIEDFDRLKKLTLMQQAAMDPDFIARCNEIQKDFASVDYPEKTGEIEW